MQRSVPAMTSPSWRAPARRTQGLVFHRRQCNLELSASTLGQNPVRLGPLVLQLWAEQETCPVQVGFQSFKWENDTATRIVVRLYACM
jgi:hypothetical protein